MRRELNGDESNIRSILVVAEQLACSERLKEQGIMLPEAKEQMARLAVMLYRSRYEDGVILIISPSCPDYSHHLDTSLGREIYDFRALEDGISLNARTLLTKSPALIEVLSRYGFKIEYRIVVADVEADDLEMVQSTGLTVDEFRQRVESSKSKLAVQAGENTVAGMMSEVLVDIDYRRANKAVALIRPERIRSIANARSNLYERQFKPKNFFERENLIVRRAREDVVKYLTFGMAARRLEAIILEATAPEVASLYNYGDYLPPTPVVMIKDKY